MMKIEKINLCKRCGKCCEAIALVSVSVERWEYLAEVNVNDSEVLFIVNNWKRISAEEALAINPRLSIWIEKYAKSGESGPFPFFQCKRLDLVTKCCNAYTDRPWVCRGYPFYKSELTLLPYIFELYVESCGFKGLEVKDGEGFADYACDLRRAPELIGAIVDKKAEPQVIVSKRTLNCKV